MAAVHRVGALESGSLDQAGIPLLYLRGKFTPDELAEFHRIWESLTEGLDFDEKESGE